jgi:hypothetical protein
VTTTVNITCDGSAERAHRVRTAAQYHDLYATSWELTANFGSGYGSERKVLRVPGADPGDDTRMRVVISCPDPKCTVRQPVRWEKLHAMLDEARESGNPSIPIKLLTESDS